MEVPVLSTGNTIQNLLSPTIFVLTTTTTTTEPITLPLCACARGNNISMMIMKINADAGTLDDILDIYVLILSR